MTADRTIDIVGLAVSLVAGALLAFNLWAVDERLARRAAAVADLRFVRLIFPPARVRAQPWFYRLFGVVLLVFSAIGLSANLLTPR